MEIVESGDTVRHHSNTLFNILPMTVYEIENGKALCGVVNNEHKLVAEWYNVNELTIVTKGNVHG